MDLLIGRKADLELVDSDGCTAIHNGCFKGQSACVRSLIAAGADLNHADVDHSTPLHKAAYAGASECLLLLLDAGVKDVPDTDGVTALHKASFNGHAECIQLLLDKDAAEVSVADSNGSTALHKASYKGHWECVRVLLDKGADVAINDGAGHTALHLACDRNHADVARALAQSRVGVVDLETADGEMSTALHLAAGSGAVECVRVLLAAGVDADARNAAGLTALDIARGHDESAVVALLGKGKEEEEGHSAVNNNVEALVVDAEPEEPLTLQRVDRWGFLGAEKLSAEEELHKQKEIEREVKWVEMREKWSSFSTRRKAKLRSRCLKGIPDSMRTFAWVKLSGADKLRASKGETYYSGLIAREEGSTPALEAIGRDLHRTFPDHVQFRTATGRGSLQRVLKAYSFHNPEIGYCQVLFVVVIRPLYFHSTCKFLNFFFRAWDLLPPCF